MLITSSSIGKAFLHRLWWIVASSRPVLHRFPCLLNCLLTELVQLSLTFVATGYLLTSWRWVLPSALNYFCFLLKWSGQCFLSVCVFVFLAITLSIHVSDLQQFISLRLWLNERYGWVCGPTWFIRLWLNERYGWVCGPTWFIVTDVLLISNCNNQIGWMWASPYSGLGQPSPLPQNPAHLP